MRDITIDLQNSETSEIQITIAINFMSLKDDEEKRVMYGKTENIKFTSYSDPNKVVDKLFDLLR